MNLSRQDWRSIGIGSVSALVVALTLYTTHTLYQDHLILAQVVAYLNGQAPKASPTPVPSVQKSEAK